MKIPNPLTEGARVALIAPSGPVSETALAAATANVRALGLEPVVFSSCTMRPGYLAGYSRERADDFTNAFSDPSIQGVFCIADGYGAHRILDRIDWNEIRKNPKVFCGSGDATVLHRMLNQHCDFATYYTPVSITALAQADDYTKTSLSNAIFGIREPVISNPPERSMHTIAKGISHGTLTGGNVTALAATLGTPYEINTKDKILFLEDSNQTPRSIDRSLLMLKQAGKLRCCAGIILGAFANCKALAGEEQAMTLGDVFADLLLDEGKPILGSVQCGNVAQTLSLPFGVNLNLDATNCGLRVLEY